jgi:hypothetical protein
MPGKFEARGRPLGRQKGGKQILHKQILHKLPSVATIGPDLLQTRKLVVEFLQHQLRPIAILDISWMNNDFQDQSERVNDDVPLPAFDLFPCVIPPGPPFSVVLAL